ncbi:PHD finger protein [Sesamum alatum]|uniref:PHD finger protein n=1 Tax=Sesamum alatum TaxID=300844 RepID=A0AAE1Y032_9LAMI|nr:PHD finger protein [Sesamum alatum]
MPQSSAHSRCSVVEWDTGCIGKVHETTATATATTTASPPPRCSWPPPPPPGVVVVLLRFRSSYAAVHGSIEEPSMELIGSAEAGSEGVAAQKRRSDADGCVLREPSSRKRIKGGVVGDVRSVAEMVLLLAAMGKMRGGRGPTDAEKELMAEARNRLVKVCEGFAPKDVFPRDAFGGVIEDLGLSKLKEQRLGFRPPKMSIAQKLLVSKRKMEKAEDFSIPSTPHSSQRLQGNSGTAVESRSVLHQVRTSQLDKSGHVAISSGNFQYASPSVRSTTVNSTSLPYQLPTNDIRPAVSNALPLGHLGSAALPRVDRPNLRSDGRSNGLSHASQVQANYSVNSSVRTPTWSMRPPSVSSAKIGLDNKVTANMSLKVEGTADVQSGLAPQMMSRTVIAPKTTGPPLHGANHMQASIGNIHAEVGKIVQKLLQPRVSEHRTWIPPSRDYMNKALTCQMCMSTTTEIGNVLICDGCEKGYHLKCLQTTNQKGVPRGEWHCGKCLSLSNGKPLPPKYGRVMRNMNTSKLFSNSAVVPSTSSENIDASEEKVSQLKVAVNGNTSVQNVPVGAAENNFSHQISGSKREEAKGMLQNDIISSRGETNDKVSSGSCPNNMMKTSSSACVPSVNSTPDEICNDKNVELKIDLPAMIEMVPDLSGKSVTMLNAQDDNLRMQNGEANTLQQSLENDIMVRDLQESHGDENLNHKPNLLKEREVVHDNSSEIVSSSGFMNQGMSPSDGLHAVNWVGDPVETLDEKIYYTSCSINGHVYKVMDHVLIRFDNDKLIPSKLQAMWEDNHSKKWVTVKRCYFPADLPEAVGRPCLLESSEVYLSTCCSTLMAGLIESPCEVLPAKKFAEETEKRSHSGTQQDDPLPPLYLCNWIYDESKGLFRDISC